MDQKLGPDERLRAVFASIFDMEPQSIPPAMSMHTLASWDSMHQIQLVLALEDEFKVSFSEEEVAKLTTFSLFAEALRKRAVR